MSAVRDVPAVIAASGYTRHGRSHVGTTFSDCTCPRVSCGGVAGGTEREDCPAHQVNPAQRWHWSANCPQVLEQARTALRRDLAVFPLPIGGRVPERGWQRLATLDETMLPELLTGHGIGIGCRASRVVALDLDVHGDDDGPGMLATLAGRLGKTVPDTFTVATPSGGLHLYFRVSADCTIGSGSGARTLGPGIDVRGPGRRTGGYLVGPGSHVNGQPYTISLDVPVAPLPEWIAARLAI
ncbi:bifunctional DNA primase/polymerase-like protein [Streptomyces sp. 846.5]|nr:bifunctional DNA primase/polymerase [Streptomyces sp. 846.5]TDT93303.1 bifunctional DNA primase/polymerase-like protein [Streptomyces sp. 846.5]